MKPSLGDTPESPKTKFLGYVVPSFFLVQVLVMASSLSCFAAYVFIGIFFVKMSSKCDADNRNLACFTMNASDISTRVNCSAIDSTFNSTVLWCYEFVFDISEALSHAGGILSMGVVAFIVTLTLILSISKGEDGRNSKLRCYCTMCIQTLMLLGILALLIVVPSIDILFDSVGFMGYLELFGLSCLLVSVICTPWCLFKKVPRALLPVRSRVNISPQTYSSYIPDGPSDNVDEEAALIINQTPRDYQSTA